MTDETSRTSTVVETAIDLYERGCNVMPLPSWFEWHMWAAQNPGNETKKPPYILSQFFSGHLHRCDSNCGRDGKPCLIDEWTFEALFENCNIGVMMGRTSENLTGIDCDSQEAFKKIGAELLSRSIPHWAFISSRGGAYIIRIAEKEIDNLPEGMCLIPDVQVWGKNHYLVFPPSLHPSSTVKFPVAYQWLTPEPRLSMPRGERLPAVSIATLDWLGVNPLREKRGRWKVTELFGLPEWTAVLSLSNRQFLSNGCDKGSRNHSLTSAAYDMAGNYIDIEDAEDLLLEAALKCRPCASATSVYAIVKSAYAKKRNPARNGSSRKEWQIAEEFGLQFNWSVYGKRQQTARAVFFACIQRAKLDNSGVFRASEREISELSNRGRDTARNALYILCGIGLNAPQSLLKWVGKNEHSFANLYAFDKSVLNFRKVTSSNRSSDLPSISSPLQLIVDGSARTNEDTPILPSTPSEKDVFGRLGIVAWRVWSYLKITPESSGEAIGRGILVNGSSVRKALISLRENGLVTFNPSDGLYYSEPKNDAELMLLATRLRVVGKSEKRHHRYSAERGSRINRLVAKARTKWHYDWKDWIEEHSMCDDIQTINPETNSSESVHLHELPGSKEGASGYRDEKIIPLYSKTRWEIIAGPRILRPSYVYSNNDASGTGRRCSDNISDIALGLFAHCEQTT